MQCKQCSIGFEAKRNDAKFCSAKCRVTFNRVTDNVTDKRGFVPAMTERALSYQAMHGKRYANGTHYDPSCCEVMV